MRQLALSFYASMNKDNLMKVQDIADDLRLSWCAIEYRMKKLNIKDKIYIKENDGPGAGFCHISSEDAERIYNFQHYRKYADYIKSSELSEDLQISPQQIGSIAKFLGIKAARGRKYGSEDKITMLYTTEQADAITAHYDAQKKVQTYEHSTSSNRNDVLNENRERSLYHRLTAYGGVLPWER